PAGPEDAGIGGGQGGGDHVRGVDEGPGGAGEGLPAPPADPDARRAAGREVGGGEPQVLGRPHRQAAGRWRRGPIEPVAVTGIEGPGGPGEGGAGRGAGGTGTSGLATAGVAAHATGLADATR